MKLKYLYLILFVLIIIFGIFVFSRSQLCTITYVIDDAIVQTEKINRNSSFPLIDSPSKDGYVFVGWYDENNTLYTEDVSIDHDVVVYARWGIIDVDDSVRQNSQLKKEVLSSFLKQYAAKNDC